MFVLVLLVVVCALVPLPLPLRRSLAYVALTVLLLGVLDATFLLWSTHAGDVRRLVGRLLILVPTALGRAILTLRLRLECTTVQHAALNRLCGGLVAMMSHDLRTLQLDWSVRGS